MTLIEEGLQGMRELNLPLESIEIREVVAEASRALASLDADRLEELALACRALNRNRLPNASSAPDFNSESAERERDQALLRQAREAAGGMRAFGRILAATRANLVVMRRMRQVREGKTEYSEAQARGWAPPEPGYGDN